MGRLVAEKLPLLALSLASIALSTMSMSSGGMSVTRELVPLALRVENAVVSYPLYLAKLFWPANLTFFYPFPEAIPLWQTAGALLILLAATAPHTGNAGAPCCSWGGCVSALVRCPASSSGLWRHCRALGIVPYWGFRDPCLGGPVPARNASWSRVRPAGGGRHRDPGVNGPHLAAGQGRKDDFALFSHGVAV
jgi:hypothetical protein